MPKIILAKSAGFCFGVNRAVNIVTGPVKQGKRVCTLGPIIHNEQMVEDLNNKGVRIASSPADRNDGEIMIIRSHGVSSSVFDEVASGGEYIDATCPYVSNIHRIVENASREGDVVIIAGDASHPEVQGIAGRAGDKYFVVSDNDELEKLLVEHKNFVENSLTAVCQTTYNAIKWRKCQETLRKVCTNAKIFDTICKATALRQQEADKLSKECDVMIVIGGRHSSNTEKLREICSSNCKHTFLIETAAELPRDTVAKAEKIGVTAGASTPPAIIKEVLINMSEMENTVVNTESPVAETESFEELLEASLVTSNDQKVKGTVLAVNSSEIQVDIGRKHTGIVPYREYSNDPNADMVNEVHVGDVLDLIIMRTNDQEGTVTLSKRRYDSIAGWDKIVEAKESGEILEGKVTEINKGGVVVTCNGVRVFVPASQATLNRVESLDFLKGTDVKFRIIEINRGRRAIGSIRSVLRDEKKAAEAKFWENIEVGQTIHGTVKTLTSYGAFVDLGGVDGMVHVSELSWNRIKHPSEVVNVGDEIDVVVKAIDLEKHKISLGYKKESDNPRTILAEKYPVGTVVKVKIVSMTDYGAFARVIDGIDGLIHISQISDHRIEKPQDVLKVGQEVDAVIADINFDNPKPRVSLSIKALLENDQQEEETADDASDAE